MLKAIFNWFTHKNPSPAAQAPAVAPEAAPYKVEVAMTAPIVKAEPVVESATVTAAAGETKPKKPTVKKPAAIKAPAKKPAAKKPAAKKSK
jgi:hypothetical protein